MYYINNYIESGTVVWANRDIFYDQPGKIITDKVNMFLVLKKDANSFYGCKLERNPKGRTDNVLRKKYYPIKYDSRVATDIYKVNFDEIASSYTFKVTEGTLENIKRNIYKKIILGYNHSPIEYQDDFVKDYISEHQPQVDNIIVYPSCEKKYKYYYIYENNEDYYSLIELKKHDIDYFSIKDTKEVLMLKSIPYFDFYHRHSLTRNDVDNVLFGTKEKKLKI